MRRFAMKAFFMMLTLGRGEKINWDRNILIFSTLVTVGLAALYLYGKTTLRW